MSGNCSGTAATATNVTVADESSDTSCNVLFTTAATGPLPPKSGTNLTFNSSSGVLTATGFAGNLMCGSTAVSLPDDAGSDEYVLQTNGVDTLTWVAQSGGGGGAVSAVANGVDNRVATFSSATALNGEANLTFDGNNLTVSSSSASQPVVEIKNTTNDTNGSILKFVKDKGAAGAANDVNGLIQFYGDDAAEDQVMFSEIKSQVKVATNGAEGGKFTISVAEHDGTSTAGLVIEDGDADGELDVTIGAGAASITTITGVLRAIGDITAFFSSDKRLKNNINPINNPLIKILKIGGYTFDWIPTEGVHNNKGKDVGVIAQEIEEILPEIVVTRDNGYKAVRYEKIIPLLIESIKELNSKIESQNIKLLEQDKKIEDLQANFNELLNK